MAEREYYAGLTPEDAVAAAPKEFRPFARALFGAMTETGALGVLVLVVNRDFSTTQSLLVHPDAGAADPSDLDDVLHVLQTLGNEQAGTLAALFDDDDDDPEPGPVS